MRKPQEPSVRTESKPHISRELAEEISALQQDLVQSWSDLAQADTVSRPLASPESMNSDIVYTFEQTDSFSLGKPSKRKSASSKSKSRGSPPTRRHSKTVSGAELIRLREVVQTQQSQIDQLQQVVRDLVPKQSDEATSVRTLSKPDIKVEARTRSPARAVLPPPLQPVVAAARKSPTRISALKLVKYASSQPPFASLTVN
jgi:hypothetical protein